MAGLTVRTESDIDLDCDACAGTLTARYDDSMNAIYIEPCNDCLEKAHNEGYDTRKLEEED